MSNENPVLLLVDDEPTNLRVLRTVLQDQYRLLFAKSGEEALQLVAQQQVAGIYQVTHLSPRYAVDLDV